MEDSWLSSAQRDKNQKKMLIWFTKQKMIFSLFFLFSCGMQFYIKFEFPEKVSECAHRWRSENFKLSQHLNHLLLPTNFAGKGMTDRINWFTTIRLVLSSYIHHSSTFYLFLFVCVANKFEKYSFGIFGTVLNIMEYNSASKHASSNSLDSDSKSSSLNSKQGVDTMVIIFAIRLKFHWKFD